MSTNKLLLHFFSQSNKIHETFFSENVKRKIATESNATTFNTMMGPKIRAWLGEERNLKMFYRNIITYNNFNNF